MQWGREMKRVMVLGAVLLVGAVSLAVTEAEQGGQVVEVERLKDNLYVLRGGGGNSAAFVTSDGVVLVDTKVAGWGQPLIDRIAELTPNPVTTIINTHAHFDHVSGNVEFPASVEVVAHTNARRLMEEWNPVTGFPGDFPNVFQTSGGQGLPTRTYDDRLTLGSGDDQVDLYYFGRGHTGGDAWVAFPALRTLHAGDVFLGQRVPFLDAANGGSGVAIPDTLQGAHDNIEGIDTIITGHSSQMTWADLNEWAAFNRDFLQMVRDGRAEGKSVDEIAAGWSLPDAYSHYDAPNAAGVQRNIQVIVDELEE